MTTVHPALSYELYPPRSHASCDSLLKTITELEQTNPDYVSVTYSGDAQRRQKTLALLDHLVHETSLNPLAHLICVGHSVADLERSVRLILGLGVRGFLALRGDMPSGALENAGFTTAQQLVAYVRELWGNNARIFVAAYPEVHPRAHTPAADLQAFRDKVAAGATDAVTQYFYNVEAFLRFRDEALALGIDVPIVPGIMPISNFNQLSRFSDACGAEIPRWLRKRLEALQDDLPALCDYGADVVAGICERLIAEGVPALHFYSMNRADLIGELCKRLGWC